MNKIEKIGDFYFWNYKGEFTLWSKERSIIELTSKDHGRLYGVRSLDVAKKFFAQRGISHKETLPSGTHIFA